MRTCTHYSAEFKENILAKVFSPNGPDAVELAKQAGVPYSTLYTWIKMKKNKSAIAPKAELRPAEQSAQARLKAVLDTMDKTEEERSAYCREHGFYPAHLQTWREQVLSGLETKPSRKDKAQQKQLTNENKKLKKELNRKDKALAEVSALLILKKKADLLWGVKEEDD